MRDYRLIEALGIIFNQCQVFQDVFNLYLQLWFVSWLNKPWSGVTHEFGCFSDLGSGL